MKAVVWRILLFWCVATWAVADVEIPALQGPVTDVSGTLNAAQQQQLSQQLLQMQQQRGAQMAVLLVPSTAPEAAFDYGMRVVEKWQLGDKQRDDGILLLLAVNDRRSQLLTGYGVEGVLPDVITNRLLREELAPRLRQGDFAGGIAAVIAKTDALLAGDPMVTAEMRKPARKARAKNNMEDPRFILSVIIAIVLALVLRPWLGRSMSAIVAAVLVFVVVLLLLHLAEAVIAALFVMFAGAGRHGHGGWGGGYGGGGYSGGGYSGGGGGFGGGGSSGSW